MEEPLAITEKKWENATEQQHSLFLFKFLFMCLCLCEWTPLACRGLWKPEEGMGPPGAGELLDMGAGN